MFNEVFFHLKIGSRFFLLRGLEVLCQIQGQSLQGTIASRWFSVYHTSQNTVLNKKIKQFVCECVSEPWRNCGAKGKKISVFQLLQRDIIQHRFIWQHMFLKSNILFLWRTVEKPSCSNCKKLSTWWDFPEIIRSIFRIPPVCIFLAIIILFYLLFMIESIFFLCDSKWLLRISSNLLQGEKNTVDPLVTVKVQVVDNGFDQPKQSTFIFHWCQLESTSLTFSFTSTGLKSAYLSVDKHVLNLADCTMNCLG